MPVRAPLTGFDGSWVPWSHQLFHRQMPPRDSPALASVYRQHQATSNNNPLNSHSHCSQSRCCDNWVDSTQLNLPADRTANTFHNGELSTYVVPQSIGNMSQRRV